MPAGPLNDRSCWSHWRCDCHQGRHWPIWFAPGIPTLTKPPNYHQPVLYDVVHRIETQGQPVHSKARRLAPDRLTVARNEFQHMLNFGIISLFSNNWSTALHMVPNVGIIELSRTVPSLIVSDLTHSRFHQCPERKLGVFQNWLDSRLSSDPDARRRPSENSYHHTFWSLWAQPHAVWSPQCCPDFPAVHGYALLCGLPFVFTYIDDLLITSPDEAIHRCHLHEVFSRLAKYSVSIT